MTILAGTASGGVTINRLSTDTIGPSAATSISLVAGESITLQTDSTGAIWNIVSGGEIAGLILAERADHSQTPAAGSGEIWLKNDSPNSLKFTDDAGTDFDIVQGAEVVSGHTRAGNVQILDDGSGTGFGLFTLTTNLSSGVAETIGPTGSGADNIWTVLDNLPSNARAIIVDCRIQVTSNAIGAYGVTISHAAGTTTPQTTNDALRGYLLNHGDTAGENGLQLQQLIIPLDSSQIFNIVWIANNLAGQNVGLYYKGFITD